MSIAPAITEAAFTEQVIQLARLHGWRTAHFRPGMSSKGRWMTAVSGDGVGFPDLVLVRNRLIAAELKVGRNNATDEQWAWLHAFRAAGAETYLWRPEHWDEIQSVLS